MGCDGIISKKGKEKGRKGKEVPEENGRQRADREKERKLTRICSNGFFTFIASYTYVGKSDCQPVFPPPHCTSSSAGIMDGITPLLSPCLSHLASSTFYLMTLIPKLIPMLLFNSRSRLCSPYPSPSSPSTYHHPPQNPSKPPP